MRPQVPTRLGWAVDTLDIQPDERILEIGCGRGAALALVCERLEEGHVTGLDRSAVALAAAEARLGEALKAGKARLLKTALAQLEPDETFDKVFAVNVNVFWTNPARELAVIRRALAPGGRLYLFYAPPSSLQAVRIGEACRAILGEEGYEVVDVLEADLWPGPGLGIVARPESG